ncbi:MAG: hypothetical protein HY228_02005 [Candidatus Yonathbacteria bacterium]|nr:hypothetical protein [Candidatus Yonathbacteria bacterium]
MNEHIESFPKETHEKDEQKVNALRKILDEKVLKDHKLNIKINKRGHYLEDTYPDASKYRLYHLLIGSTIPADAKETLIFDFEGEDSIEKFIESL